MEEVVVEVVLEVEVIQTLDRGIMNEEGHRMANYCPLQLQVLQSLLRTTSCQNQNSNQFSGVTFSGSPILLIRVLL